MQGKQLMIADSIQIGAKSRKVTKTQQKLHRIHNAIQWDKLEKLCEGLYNNDTTKGGRPPLALIIKIKMLFLQHLYNMSDEMLEEFITDNLSYQRFLGLLNSDSVPDFTTYWKFKERLIEKNIMPRLWELVNEQLMQKGLQIEPGHLTLIDATIKQSSQRPLSKEKRKEEKDNSHIDTDATSTEKHGKKYFGYKGHIGIDADTKLIHSKEFTTAKVHDVKMTEELASGQEKEIIADKGYVSKKLKIKASKVDLIYNAMYRATRSRELSDEEKQQNKIWSKKRARVEHVFGYMKKSFNYHYARARTIARNELVFTMNCILYNVLRVDWLGQQKSRVLKKS